MYIYMYIYIKHWQKEFSGGGCWYYCIARHAHACVCPMCLPACWHACLQIVDAVGALGNLPSLLKDIAGMPACLPACVLDCLLAHLLAGLLLLCLPCLLCLMRQWCPWCPRFPCLLACRLDCLLAKLQSLKSEQSILWIMASRFYTKTVL